MNLIRVPIKYEISVNNNGEYEDSLCGLTTEIIENNNGITCGCNGHTRVYKKYNRLKVHTSTKKHIEWVKTLNINKETYYIKTLELEEELKEKKILINEKDQEIQKLIYQVIKQDKLIKKMKTEYIKKIPTEVDLINFD